MMLLLSSIPLHMLIVYFLWKYPTCSGLPLAAHSSINTMSTFCHVPAPVWNLPVGNHLLVNHILFSTFLIFMRCIISVISRLFPISLVIFISLYNYVIRLADYLCHCTSFVFPILRVCSLCSSVNTIRKMEVRRVCYMSVWFMFFFMFFS